MTAKFICVCVCVFVAHCSFVKDPKPKVRKKQTGLERECQRWLCNMCSSFLRVSEPKILFSCTVPMRNDLVALAIVAFPV